MDFDIVESTRGQFAVLAVHGELDVATAPLLRDRLIESLASHSGGLLVDLQGVGFLDSSGLRALLIGQNAATAEGATFGLICADPGTLKVFQITQLDQVFEIHPSVEVATAPGQ